MSVLSVESSRLVLLNSSILQALPHMSSISRDLAQPHSQSFQLARRPDLRRVKAAQDALTASRVLLERLLIQIDRDGKIAHWALRTVLKSRLHVLTNALSLQEQTRQLQRSTEGVARATHAEDMPALRFDWILGLIETNPARDELLHLVLFGVQDGLGRFRLEDEIGMISHLAHARDERENVGVVVEHGAFSCVSVELALDIAEERLVKLWAVGSMSAARVLTTATRSLKRTSSSSSVK